MILNPRFSPIVHFQILPKGCLWRRITKGIFSYRNVKTQTHFECLLEKHLQYPEPGLGVGCTAYQTGS